MPVRIREQAEKGIRDRSDAKDMLSTVVQLLDPRDGTFLWLETAWFMLVNVATGYVFLYRDFSWPQEPGKVQRFLW